MGKTLFGVFDDINELTKKKRKKRTKKKTPIKKYPVKRTEHFHKKKHIIGSTILGTLNDGEIIYGEQALKAHFPKYLERPTTDYDIFAKHPKREAHEAERALDRRFGGNFFYVRKADHPGTYKVVAYANEEGYADFTRKPKHVPYKTIRGKRYVKLSYEKKKRMKILRDQNYSWRHAKDRDALNRIAIYRRRHPE